MIYNTKYATDPILIVAGDDIDFWIHVEEFITATQLWTEMDLTGYELHLKLWNKHGTEIVDWSTVDGTIVINVADLNILADSLEGSCCGSFDGQLYIEDPKRTLWKGIVKVV